MTLKITKSRNVFYALTRICQRTFGNWSIKGRDHVLKRKVDFILSGNVSLQQHRTITQSSSTVWFAVDTPPVSYAYNVLTSFHDSVGLPWWAAIIVSTVVLRTCTTLPIFVISAKNTAKLELLAPEVKKLAEELKMEVAYAKMQFKWPERMASLQFKRNLKRHVQNLYERDNCHPAKNLILPWIQIPIWLSMSFSLRNMSGMNTGEVLHPEMAAEGILWFQDLLLPDYVGLPLIFCTANFLIMEMHNLKVKDPTRTKKLIINFLRASNIVFFPIAAYCPSSLTLFWACSSTYGLLQNILLSCPRVKRVFGIAQTPSESKTPFLDAFNILKARFKLTK